MHEPPEPIAGGRVSCDQSAAAMASASLRAYGVRLDIRADDGRLLAALVDRLPPGSRARRPDAGSLACSVSRTASPGADAWRVCVGGEWQEEAASETAALDAFEGFVRFEVARRAQLWTFVHAGVVAWNGRAIVMPGYSFSGKSTLVHALVRAGATYYSDEFCVLDQRGRVFPFTQPLVRRDERGGQSRLPLAALGGPVGGKALPVGMVVATRYVADAVWNPTRTSPGEGLLALIEHTVRAQDAPARVMRVLARVAETAPTFAGTRGEADQTAARILNRAAVWHSHLEVVA